MDKKKGQKRPHTFISRGFGKKIDENLSALKVKKPVTLKLFYLQVG